MSPHYGSSIGCVAQPAPIRNFEVSEVANMANLARLMHRQIAPMVISVFVQVQATITSGQAVDDID